MNNIFSDNLKKFRLAKGLTQEQVAEKLNVNSQTVSRWECGTTLPDVLTLPELARFYEVTVDDFYKKNSVAYDNYAQRLASVYENSHDPEDFMRCRVEYEKLIKNGELSTADKWQYGWIHMYMMNYCRDVAVEWYDKAVSDDPNDDPENYHIACMQRIWMFFLLKKEDEIISELREKAKSNPDNPRETDNLLVALIWAEKYDDAYNLFRGAIEKFPDDWGCIFTAVILRRISRNMMRLWNITTKPVKSGHISAMRWTAKRVCIKIWVNSKKHITSI